MFTAGEADSQLVKQNLSQCLVLSLPFFFPLYPQITSDTTQLCQAFKHKQVHSSLLLLVCFVFLKN